MVPVEIGMPLPWVKEFNPQENEISVRLNLDLLEEHREIAHLRVVEYKNRILRYYNTIVRGAFRKDI